MNTTTPTAASLLIDTLSPKQRAVLFTALHAYKTILEGEHNEHITGNKMQPALAQRMSDFLRWHIKESKEILNTLFAECFHDDLDTLKFFQHDLPNTTTKKFEKPTA